MPVLSNDKIHSIYASSRCLCGAAKWENSAFCDGCYEDLSIKTKIKLTRKFREGFEVAFRIACAELDGAEPPPNKTDERSGKNCRSQRCRKTVFVYSERCKLRCGAAGVEF